MQAVRKFLVCINNNLSIKALFGAKNNWIWYSLTRKCCFIDSWHRFWWGCQQDEARLFMVVYDGHTRSNGHKLKQKRFRLAIRRIFFRHKDSHVVNWLYRFPRELVQYPFLEIFKARLYKAPSNLAWPHIANCLWAGGLTLWPPKLPSRLIFLMVLPYHFSIISFNKISPFIRKSKTTDCFYLFF